MRFAHPTSPAAMMALAALAAVVALFTSGFNEE